MTEAAPAAPAETEQLGLFGDAEPDTAAPPNQPDAGAAALEEPDSSAGTEPNQATETDRAAEGEAAGPAEAPEPAPVDTPETEEQPSEPTPPARHFEPHSRAYHDGQRFHVKEMPEDGLTVHTSGGQSFPANECTAEEDMPPVTSRTLAPSNPSGGWWEYI